jgi:RNA polymerase sigma factor (sigma-70 family)
MSESELKWSRFVSGDKEAYCWLYNTYVQILYAYGLRFTSDSEIIKDCIQDIFTQLYKDRNRLTAPDNVKVYLLVSLKNNLIRALDRASVYDSIQPETTPFLLEPTVEDQLIDQEQADSQQKKIEEMLSILTPRQKEIIYYRFIQQLSMDEIGALMNIHYQSAQNLIQRSLKKLRETYGVIDIWLLLLSVLLA